MRVVLVGARGQLAQDLLDCWPRMRPGDELLRLTHEDVRVEDRASVETAIRPLAPDLVLNTSAFHRVDDIEDEPERALAVNAVGPRNLALLCRDLGAVLVHVSTDYVFSGAKGAPYVESDPIDPPNVYGVSKGAGEMLVRATWPRHFIVRSSGLYGIAGSAGKGGNFVETMLRLSAAGGPIRVVDDQVLTPTFTGALAPQIASLAGTSDFGTYHATCAGQCSWFEFAQEIFRLAGVSPELKPQTTEQSGARARRPNFSVLENEGLKRLGIDQMPDWREALGQYLQLRHARAATG